MSDKTIFILFVVVFFIAGVLIIGFMDGFWDALGVFLIIWSNNSGYKRESITEKIKSNKD